MKYRRKRSAIWTKLSDDEFKDLVNRSKTFVSILDFFGLKSKGGNNNTIKSRMKDLGIDYSHITLHYKFKKRNNITLIPYENILVENSTYCRNNLKQRLIKDKIIEHKCQDCGLGPMWNGKFLSLVLDHINGIPNDNRIENLRFLCSNCNSQTSTFAGKKNKRVRSILYNNCILCGNPKPRKSKKCLDCKMASKHLFVPEMHKVPHPPKEILEQEIKEMSWTALGKKYNVSDNAIKKWAKSYNIHFITKEYNKLRET